MLRRALRARGLAFQSNARHIQGRPDIVFSWARVVVFCDGDFWHGRKLRSRVAKLADGHNAAYWVAKIKANVARDRRNSRSLRAQGWSVLRVWEGDVVADSERVVSRIEAYLKPNNSRSVGTELRVPLERF